jgi:hypothetical protein
VLSPEEPPQIVGKPQISARENQRACDGQQQGNELAHPDLPVDIFQRPPLSAWRSVFAI